MTRTTNSAAFGTKPTIETATATADVVEPAFVDGVDVDAVARAVRACAGVADLHSGRFGEIGSYLPGRRIGGVQVDDARVTVHIRARWGYGVHDVFAQIDAVTTTLRRGRRINVVVDDIDNDPGASAPSSVTPVAPPLALDAPAHSPLAESSTS